MPRHLWRLGWYFDGRIQWHWRVSTLSTLTPHHHAWFHQQAAKAPCWTPHHCGCRWSSIAGLLLIYDWQEMQSSSWSHCLPSYRDKNMLQFQQKQNCFNLTVRDVTHCQWSSTTYDLQSEGQIRAISTRFWIIIIPDFRYNSADVQMLNCFIFCAA